MRIDQESRKIPSKSRYTIPMRLKNGHLPDSQVQKRLAWLKCVESYGRKCSSRDCNFASRIPLV